MRTIAMLLAATAVVLAQPAPSLAGPWSGAIDVPGLKLGIEVQLKEGSTWSGHISIPVQGIQAFPLTELRVAGSEFSFQMAGIPGNPAFKGRLAGDGTVQGTFTQGGQSFPFHLQRGALPAAVKPARPAGLRERELTVGADPWKLPATLTLPAGKGPFPGVVLVHGSGPHDRDESIGPNAPFRDLAWGLAQRGVAVLRYEKRTKAHAAAVAGQIASLTVWEETVLDAAQAAERLRAQPELDPARIVVLGHSLGGYLLPRIAGKAPFLRGLVSLAGSTRPMEDLIVEQLTYLGAPEARVAAARSQAARVKALEPGKDPGAGSLFGAPAAYWMDLKGYVPGKEARSLPQAMLILQGDRDYQVGRADFEGWAKALEGRQEVRLRRFPHLNHLFFAGEGPSTPAEYQQPGQVDAAVIEEIARWISALPKAEVKPAGRFDPPAPKPIGPSDRVP